MVSYITEAFLLESCTGYTPAVDTNNTTLFFFLITHSLLIFHILSESWLSMEQELIILEDLWLGYYPLCFQFINLSLLAKFKGALISLILEHESLSKLELTFHHILSILEMINFLFL